MAVQLTAELGFGTVGLGAAVAMHRGPPALSSPYLGRLADELGALRSIRLATTLGALASLGIAFTARNWASFVPWMMLSGIANSLAQPAANRLLAQEVPTGRLGLAFGLKQSAPPTASTLAGLSVPLIAVALGWRWAFVAAAALGLLVAYLATPTDARVPEARRERLPGQKRLGNRGLLITISIAFGLNTGASSAVTTFFVDSISLAGMSAQQSGYIFAVGGAAAIIVRVFTGHLSDSIPRGHLKLCAMMIAIGTVGYVLLASNRPVSMSLGVLIAMTGGWGFNAVFWFALISAYSDFPGEITGAIFPGGLLGATAGPVAFGIIANRWGYPTMWYCVATLSVLASGALWFAATRLETRGP